MRSIKVFDLLVYILYEVEVIVVNGGLVVVIVGMVSVESVRSHRVHFDIIVRLLLIQS